MLRTLNRKVMSDEWHPVYFSEKELNRLTPSCSLSDMDERFLKKLDFARSIAGIPFVLNCAYRSREWDLKKGRDGSSYHCLGRAVDIRCVNSEYRARIIYSCLNAGFKSIGIYKNFLHVDDRWRDEPNHSIIWLGEEW